MVLSYCSKNFQDLRTRRKGKTNSRLKCASRAHVLFVSTRYVDKIYKKIPRQSRMFYDKTQPLFGYSLSLVIAMFFGRIILS